VVPKEGLKTRLYDRLLVFRIRPAATAAGSAATSTAPTAGIGRRERVRHELRTRRRSSPRANDDELTTVVHVGHRQTDLRAGKLRLPELLTSRLIVRVEEGLPSGALAGEHERLRHHDAGL
jgi:hypothetical protein